MVHAVGFGVTSEPHQCIVPMVVLVQLVSLAFQHTVDQEIIVVKNFSSTTFPNEN